VAVHILVPEEPGPEIQAWAQSLAAAIDAGYGALTLAATPEEAAAVVRIDSVQTGVEWDPEPPGEGEISVMHFALILGQSSREFDVAYRGDATPQAQALARNLRGVAANGAAASSATEGAEDPETPGADEADAGDEG
jgi:hypothetical protein